MNTDSSPSDTSGFDRSQYAEQGRWMLLIILAGCLLIIPGFLYIQPGILGMLGFPYIVSLLVLPLIPAVMLGAIGVYTLFLSDHREEDEK